jgi:hypothetical protein
MRWKRWWTMAPGEFVRSALRGLDWDSMTEQEREQLIDELLHEGGA